MNIMKKINKMCIDDVTDILNFGDGIKELTYGKEYTILETYDIKPNRPGHLDTMVRKPSYSIINDKGIREEYYCERFVDKAEFRNMKINKILE
jgi:hypothetical protein